MSNLSSSTNNNSQILQKWFSYTFKITNIYVEVVKEKDSFHISNIQYKRIGTGNDGNHIIPITFFLSLIKHFFIIGSKTYDCFSKAQCLLEFFHKIPSSKEEYEVIKDELQNRIDKNDSICCPQKVQVFFSNIFIPYLLYVWDTRVSAKHFDSKYEVSQEATLVRTLNETINNLVYSLDSINLEEQLYNIRNKLFKVLDIPIFIQQNTKIKNNKDKNVINQYLKEILLFLVHNVKKNLNSSVGDEFNPYIKYLQNKKLEIEINARKVQSLLNSLSAQKQHMEDKYYKIINNLQAGIKNTKTLNINIFYKNNEESLKYLVQNYFNLILYDTRKHLSLLLLTVQQQTYDKTTMDYFCTSQYKNFLKTLLNKKDCATEFIQFINKDYKKKHNKFLIYNQKAIISMLDNDDSEFSFQFSNDTSLLDQHENPRNIYKLIDKYFYTNSVNITTEQRIKFIEYILELDVESNSVVIAKLEDAKIGNISVIQWYINTCFNSSTLSEFSKEVKNILTKCNERTLKKININEQTPYKWYFNNQQDQENRIEVTNSLLRHSDSYVIEFCQYILTLDIPIIKAKGGKIRDSYPFFTWYIKSISEHITDNTPADLIAAINNILIKCNQDIIRDLLDIKINGQEFLEWYINNRNINNNTKLDALKSIIGKCDDTLIMQLIEYIIFPSQDDYTCFSTELANIQIHDQQAINWYLGNRSVTHNDKVAAIKTIIPIFDDNNILAIIKDILGAVSTDLKKELANIQIHDQQAINWYLGNRSVTHNDKVAAIKTIIPIFDDNNILAIIKDILGAVSTDLKKELANIQIHDQQAINWYLGNRSVTHNDKVAAIKTIIPIFDDNNILVIIKDILDAVSTDLKKELVNIQIHNQLAINWYLGNRSVTHNNKVTAIKTICEVIDKECDYVIMSFIIMQEIIKDILTANDTDLKKALINIQVYNQSAIQWYLGSHSVTHDDKVTAIKDILTANSTDLKKELANIQVHNQPAINWYLGNHNVTHNDKVTAIKSISTFDDNHIFTIIKDILTGGSTDLKKELANIQVHNQPAINWYLGNHNVTHNDKVTAIKTIIPVLNDNDILTIIKDILTADNLNLIDALGREVTIHNKQAMKWYLSSVNHIEIIQHIEKIISLYNQTSDATLYDVIDYIITHCDQLLLKELDTKTTINGLSILHWYIKYMIDLTYNDIIDTNDIARSLYSILMECSRNTIQSIEQLHINDQLIFHWYMQHIKEHGINLNNYENDINDLVYQDVGTSVIQILMKCNTDTIQSIEHLYYNNVPIFYWYINNYVDSDQYMIQALHNILIKCSINTVQLIEMADVNNTSVFLYYVKYIRTHGANFDNTYDYVEDDLMQVLNYIQLKCSENTIQQISRLHMNREPILQWYNNMRYNGFYEMDGLDQKSIHYNLQNIHGAKRMLNQSKVIVEYVHEYNKYLSILGIQDYKDNNHAVVFFKYGDSLSIIDPLDYISGCSNSFIKLKNQFLSSGIKTIDIVYSGLQQPDSGVCADISLILVKNLADKLQDIQSVQDVISVIQDVRVEMYGRTLEKNQETIIIKSFDAVISKVIDVLTRLNNYDVGIQDKQQQNNCSVNNEFVSTVQQDNFFIKPTELTGDIVSYTT
ncbi:MAG: hypothetical protein RCO49_08255 [Rickettsia endosymbiont of Argas persicus]